MYVIVEKMRLGTETAIRTIVAGLFLWTGAVGPSLGEVDEDVPGPSSGGGIGKRVAVIDVHGVIDLGLAPYLVRTLSNPAGLDMVILDIDTPGGRMDAALIVRDALLESEVRTIAFVHPRAISAGALIAYACETIAVSRGASMGAATPVTLGPGGGAHAASEKMISYMRAEMSSTAKARGRRGDIAEAMVDPDVHIEGITDRGKLLTLDTDAALVLGVADTSADDLDALLASLYLDGAEILRPGPTWAERLARALTHPALSGLLMALGLLGLLMELRTPGFGAAGIVGLSCLAIFFFGHMVVHLAGWEELLLFGVGALLLMVEIFVTPGFGAAGVLGIAALFAALILALSGLPLDLSLVQGELLRGMLRVLASAALAMGAFALFATLLPHTKAGKPLVLEKALPAGPSHQGASGAMPGIGDRGRTVTILRPTGKVRLAGQTWIAESEGPFVDGGREVVVVGTKGDCFVVREVGPVDSGREG